MRGVGSFLADTWRLSKPYFVSSEERWSARGLLLTCLVMRLLMVQLTVYLSYWSNAFFTTLQDKDWNSFVSLLISYKPTPARILPGFVYLVVVFIVIAVYRVYLTQLLQIRWRRWMTRNFIDRWMSERVYYRLSLVAPGDARGITTDNPDQRIAEDIRDFIGDGVVGTQGVLFFGIDFIANIVSLYKFMFILVALSGPISLWGWTIPVYMVWVAILYSIIGTTLTHLVGRKLVPLNFLKQRVEADFRFALVRLRENTEGVALYSGEAEERRGLGLRFEALVSNWWGLMRRTKYLNALTAGYGQLAGIFPLIAAAPQFFFGKLTLGALTQTADAFGQVQGSMSWFVDNYNGLAVWRATVDRLASFKAAMDGAHAAAAKGVNMEPRPGDTYALHDATIDLPNGERLLSHSNLTFVQGQSVVVTGRSGAGKSTLFRALAGIWPFGEGHVQRPRGSSLFLPQRPYIPLGTLRHALTYPRAGDAYDDATVRAALQDCGLAHLSDRLDQEDSWTQRLSGGELQRVAIARALLARPDWLFLDEATANLDPDAEAAMYRTLMERLPATTIISIAHRPAVAAHHDLHLRFERPPGRLVPVGRETAAAAD